MLTRDDPLLVTGTVDAPFGEGEAARERLRFNDAKLLSAVRAEKSTTAGRAPERRRRSPTTAWSRLKKLMREHPGRAGRSCGCEIPKRSETRAGPGRRPQGRRQRRAAGPHRSAVRRARRRPALARPSPAVGCADDVGCSLARRPSMTPRAGDPRAAGLLMLALVLGACGGSSSVAGGSGGSSGATATGGIPGAAGASGGGASGSAGGQGWAARQERARAWEEAPAGRGERG